MDGKAAISEVLGREPNQFELSQHLKWSPKEVRRMESEMRHPSPTADWEDEPTGIRPSRETEVVRLVHYELSGEEKLVHEYLFGLGGKQRLNPGQVAKKLNWTPSKITRIKNRIMEKINQYL